MRNGENDRWTDDQIGDGVREAYPRTVFPKAAIAERIAATLGSRSPDHGSRFRRPRRHGLFQALLAAAAAIAVFVGGAEYGRRSLTPSPAPAPDVTPGIPLAIQASGTRYVSDLTRFAQNAPGLSASEREEARQAAVAILYSAVIALQTEADDELLEAAGQLIHSLRRSQRGPATERVFWF